MTPTDADILMARPVDAHQDSGEIVTQPAGQHLVYFTGGMLALGGRLIQNETHLHLGRKVTDGCLWAYNSSPLRVMPETYTVVPCNDLADCTWNESKWYDEVKRRHQYHADMNAASIIERERLLAGFFSSMNDCRYSLRPEAIEIVFVLCRVTGDKALQDVAWRMFSNIANHTETEFANAALNDGPDPSAPKSDSMVNFFTTEILRYFYLISGDPNLISLNEHVFNTEAHPLKRGTGQN